MIGIYKVENLINGKIYIGQSVNIENRWKEHRYGPYTTTSSQYNTPFYRAIRKYEVENFSFEVIEECEPEELNEREIYWISKYKSTNLDKGYNLTKGGHHVTPLVLSEEDVEEIQWLLSNTPTSQQEIADRYDVDQSLISLINRGKIWVNSNLKYPLRNREKRHCKINQQKRSNSKSGFCIDCKKPISYTSTRCRSCDIDYRREKGKEEKPVSRDELKELVRTTSFLELGREFGVSDNAIRKWCKLYDLPSRKRDIEKYTDEEWELV